MRISRDDLFAFLEHLWEPTPELGLVDEHDFCYRGTGIALNFHHTGKIFVAHRIPNEEHRPSKKFELPQGAVGWFSETNAPESTLMAARRENFEEFGFGEKEILQLPSMTEHHWYPLRKNWSHYDFNMVGCSAFLVRDGVQPNLYTGNNDEDPEFDEWKLIDLKDLPEEGPSHKRMPYTAIARDFAPVAEALKAIAHIQLSPEERAAHVWRDAAVQTAMREGKLGDDIPAFSGVHLVSSHDKAFKAHRSSRLNSRSEHSAVLRAA